MFIFLFFLSYLSALFESSVLANMNLFGGVIEIGFAITLFFIFFRSFKFALYFLLFNCLFLSVLTKISIIYFLFPPIIIVSIFYFLFSKRIVSAFSIFSCLIFSFFAVFLNDFIKLIFVAEITVGNFYQILANSFSTAIITVFMFFVFEKMQVIFNPQASRERIRF